MRETRRSLKAENLQLKNQMSPTLHPSRRSLNEHVGQLKARNTDLVDTITRMEREIAALKKAD